MPFAEALCPMARMYREASKDLRGSGALQGSKAPELDHLSTLTGALEALLSLERFTGLRSLNRCTELRELRSLRRLSSFAALETEGFYRARGARASQTP